MIKPTVDMIILKLLLKLKIHFRICLLNLNLKQIHHSTTLFLDVSDPLTNI